MDRSDHWDGCTEFSENTRCTAGDYIEYGQGISARFGKEGMLIYEPCNYASNIAYYQAAMRVCKHKFSVDKMYVRSLKRSFSTMAIGSSFLHGSHTYVGYSFDRNMIALTAYLAHQVSVNSLPGDSSILK